MVVGHVATGRLDDHREYVHVQLQHCELRLGTARVELMHQQKGKNNVYDFCPSK
jgi:hypothetical protein